MAGDKINIEISRENHAWLGPRRGAGSFDDAITALKDDAEDARELYTTLKLVYVLATSGVGPDDERWKTVIKRAEDVLFPDEDIGLVQAPRAFCGETERE